MARNDPEPEDEGFSLPNPPAVNTLNVLSTLARSRLAKSVRPFAYSKNLEGEPSTARSVMRAGTSFLSGEPDMEAGYAPDRRDAWRLYLGLGQENNTFRPSEAPPDSILRKSGFFSEADSSDQFIEYANPENRRSIINDARRLIRSDESVMQTQDRMNRERYLQGDTTRVGNLGHYTLRQGKDEKGPYVSYEDKWDIAVNPLEGTVGDPMNVYGKLRYNPETGEFMNTDKKAHGGFIRNHKRKALYGPGGDVKYATPNREYGIGGFLRRNASSIGTVAGAGIGLATGNPVAGATIGGAAGKAIESTGREEEEARSRLSRPINTNRRPTYASLGNEGNFARGGMIPMGQDAAKFTGPSHANGGIDVGNNTEVEGGETVDFIYDDDSGLMDGDGNPYVFSDRLKLPDSETTFSEAHESLIQSGAGEQKVRQLANLQERVSGRSGSGKATPRRTPVTGPRMLDEGGEYHAIKASETSGDEPKYPINSADDVRDAWKLRSHGDYNISQEKLEQRIKRKANEYDVDLPDEKAYGGKMKRKYQNGGRVPGLDPEEFGYSIPNTLAGTSAPSPQSAAARLDGDPGYMDNINEEDTGLLEGTSGEAIQAGAQVLPAITNLIRGQQDIQKPRSSFVPMSGDATDTLRGMETDVNVDPQLASTRASLRAVTTNPNASANERLAAMSASNRQRSKILSTAQNRETQLENQRAQAVAQSEQNVEQSNTRRLQRDLARRNEIRRRSQAAKQNLTSTGIRQLSTGVQDFMRRRRIEEAQEAQLGIQTLMADPAVTQGVIEELGKALPDNRYINKLTGIGN